MPNELDAFAHKFVRARLRCDGPLSASHGEAEGPKPTEGLLSGECLGHFSFRLWALGFRPNLPHLRRDDQLPQRCSISRARHKHHQVRRRRRQRWLVRGRSIRWRPCERGDAVEVRGYAEAVECAELIGRRILSAIRRIAEVKTAYSKYVQRLVLGDASRRGSRPHNLQPCAVGLACRSHHWAVLAAMPCHAMPVWPDAWRTASTIDDLRSAPISHSRTSVDWVEHTDFSDAETWHCRSSHFRRARHGIHVSISGSTEPRLTESPLPRLATLRGRKTT